MTTYTLAWGYNDDDPSGQNTVRVHTSHELDTALDTIAANSSPVMVTIYPGTWTAGQPTPPHGFQLMWGHPHRAVLSWFGNEAATASDPHLPPWPEPIGHDLDSAEPWLTRITPAQARVALHEYLRTEARPTTVAWDDQ